MGEMKVTDPVTASLVSGLEAFGQMAPGRFATAKRLGSPLALYTTPSIQQIEEVAQQDPEIAALLKNMRSEQELSQRRKALYFGGKEPTEEDYRKNLTKLIALEEREVRKQRSAAAKEYQEKVAQIEPIDPSWPLDDPRRTMAAKGEALAHSGAKRAAGYDRIAPAFKDESAVADEIAREAERRALGAQLYGRHRAPLSDDEIAETIVNIVQAQSAEGMAKFAKEHPAAYRVATGAGGMAALLPAARGAAAAGSLLTKAVPSLGRAVSALGAAKPLVTGTAELGAAGLGLQEARIATGAQAERDFRGEAGAAALFGGMSAVGRFAGEALLGRRLAQVVKLKGAPLTEDALAAVAKGVEKSARPEIRAVIDVIDKARSAAGHVENITTFGAYTAVQGALAVAERMQQDESFKSAVGVEALGALTDTLTALLLTKGMPPREQAAKRFEAVERLTGLGQKVIEPVVMEKLSEAQQARRGQADAIAEKLKPADVLAESQGKVEARGRAAEAEKLGAAMEAADTRAAYGGGELEAFEDAHAAAWERMVREAQAKERVAYTKQTVEAARRVLEQEQEARIWGPPTAKTAEEAAARVAALREPRAEVRAWQEQAIRATGQMPVGREPLRPLEKLLRVEPAPKAPRPPRRIVPVEAEKAGAVLAGAAASALRSGNQRLATALGDAFQSVAAVAEAPREVPLRLERLFEAARQVEAAKTAEDLPGYRASRDELAKQIARAVSHYSRTLSKERSETLALERRYAGLEMPDPVRQQVAANHVRTAGDWFLRASEGSLKMLGMDGAAELAQRIESGRLAVTKVEKLPHKTVLHLSDKSTVTLTPEPSRQEFWDQARKALTLTFAASAIGQAMGADEMSDEEKLANGSFMFLLGAGTLGSKRADMEARARIREAAIDAAKREWWKPSASWPLRKLALGAAKVFGKVRGQEVDSAAVEAGVDRIVRATLGVPTSAAAETVRLAAEEKYGPRLLEIRRDMGEFAKLVKDTPGSETVARMFLELEELGHTDLSRYVDPALSAKWQPHVDRIKAHARWVGDHLADYGALPEKVFDAPGQKPRVVMRGETAPPQAPGETLTGGVEHFKQTPYFTHARKMTFKEALRTLVGSAHTIFSQTEAAALKERLRSWGRHRTKSSEEWLTDPAADVSLGPTYETLASESKALIALEMVQQLKDGGYVVSTKGTADPNAAPTPDFAAIKTERDRINTALADLRKKDRVLQKAAKGATGAALEKVAVERRLIDANRASLLEARDANEQQANGYIQLGKEFAKFSGDWMRRDLYDAVVDQDRFFSKRLTGYAALGGAIKALQIGFGSPARIVFDFLGNVLGLSNASGGKIASKEYATAAKHVYEFWKTGSVPDDPIFRRLVVRGTFDEIGTTTELSARDRKSFDARARQAEQLMAEGEPLNAAMMWAAALGTAIGEGMTRVPGLKQTLGAMSRATMKGYPLADRIAAYALMRMLMSGENNYGRKFTFAEALNKVKHGYDVRHTAGIVRFIRAVWPQFITYQAKTVETVLYNAPYLRPKVLGVPVPFVNQLTRAMGDPGSAKSKAAATAWASVAVGSVIASQVIPALAARSTALAMSGVTEEEFEAALADRLRNKPKILRPLYGLYLLPSGMKDGKVQLWDVSYLGLLASSSQWLGDLLESDNARFTADWYHDLAVNAAHKNVILSPLLNAAGITSGIYPNRASDKAIALAGYAVPGLYRQVAREIVKQANDDSDTRSWGESVASTLLMTRPTAGDTSTDRALVQQAIADGRIRRNKEGFLEPVNRYDKEAWRLIEMATMPQSDAEMRAKMKRKDRSLLELLRTR